MPNQPLTVMFTVSNSSSVQQEQELITLQALICQLDVATERFKLEPKLKNELLF
jgi:hypothetical protein